MQGLNSSVITAHVVLNVQGPLGNRDGNRIMRHAVKEGFQHQGENLKSSFLADIRFQ